LNTEFEVQLHASEVLNYQNGRLNLSTGPQNLNQDYLKIAVVN
jgi:hypothetical protein